MPTAIGDLAYELRNVYLRSLLRDCNIPKGYDGWHELTIVFRESKDYTIEVDTMRLKEFIGDGKKLPVELKQQKPDEGYSPGPPPPRGSGS
jgi:hypothetical protein